jgi:hypothetical protein
MSPRWHAWRLPAAACAAALALLLAGCSFSYQLDSLFAKRDDADTTGSLRLAPKQRAAEEAPAGSDLDIARAAINEVLTKGGNDISVPWENPSTGARGTITPVASAYTQDGITCRDFLASYVKGANESWLQGAACRAQRGKWEIRRLRPWKNS